VLEPRGAERRDLLVEELLRRIHAVELGAERAGDAFHFEHALALHVFPGS